MRAANITHQWIIVQNDQALNPEYIQKVCKCKAWGVMCTYMHNWNLDSSFFRQGAVFCNLCPLSSRSLGTTTDRYLGFTVSGEVFFPNAMTLWKFSCTPKAPLWKKNTGVLARHWIPRRMCTRTNSYIVMPGTLAGQAKTLRALYCQPLFWERHSRAWWLSQWGLYQWNHWETFTSCSDQRRGLRWRKRAARLQSPIATCNKSPTLIWT